ncbi:MAG: MATE family efflux transporter [Candidatus Gastranaerophilales bacterium]|nr:MATE family efflux transporter [Candidatus Gastranaerophilales bacterium]
MNKLTKQYFIDLLILSIPLFIGNLGHTLIGATDVLVVAKYSIDALAAISIANSILFTIFILGIGILCAISILLSNMRGSGERTKKHLLSTLVFSSATAILFSGICYASKFFVPMMNFEAHIVPYIEQYIAIVSFSMLGMFLFEGIKQFLQSYEIVNFPNALLLFSVILNLIFDIVFVFGFGPIPSMGSQGAAIATTLVRILMGLVMFIYVFRFIDFKAKIDFGYMKQIIKIGTPIGLALLFEFLAFNIITILVGRESGLLAAVHNILVTISSATFMFPLSLATATSVKVAYYYGAKKCDEIRNYIFASTTMCMLIMILISLTLIIFPSQIIRLFTDDVNVMKIALPIMSVVAAYQIFDGLQIIMGGTLKGFKMTKVVSASVMTGYWLIGLPVAVVCVSYYNLSLKGYWIALAISLCSMGIGQAALVKYKFKKIKEICN